MTIQPPSAALGMGEAQEVGEIGFTEPPIAVSAPAENIDHCPTDEHLLALFLRGDRNALGTLAERHERHLLGLAHAILGGRRDLAMDAVQDTWVRVIKYGRSFRSGSTVKTWLYRILVNACKDARTRASRMRLTGPERERAGALETARSTHAPDDTPTQSRIRSAIESLPGDHRLLILLCYHQGLTHPQAADVLDIPVGTLKSRLHAALNTLRKNLTPDLSPENVEGTR